MMQQRGTTTTTSSSSSWSSSTITMTRTVVTVSFLGIIYMTAISSSVHFLLNKYNNAIVVTFQDLIESSKTSTDFVHSLQVESPTTTLSSGSNNHIVRKLRKSNSTTSTVVATETTAAPVNDSTEETIDDSTATGGHDSLFPLTKSDYWGIFFAVLGLLLASGGGIGGGGILVPIFVLVMNFNAKNAIPLSSATVAGGAIANTLLNLQKRHPIANRPLIDWDLVLVMEPLTILGAFFGALFNKVLPELLLLISLVVLLGFTAQETLQKAIKMYKKETAALAAAAAAKNNDSAPSEVTKLTSNTGYESIESKLEMQEVDPVLTKILEEESRTPIRSVLVLVVAASAVLTINILKGGGAFQSPLGIECGSTEFWFSNFILVLVLGAVAVDTRYHLLQKHQARLATPNYPFVSGDIPWDDANTIKYPLLCVAAGFAAGLFGIGGGMVQGPLLLAMGVHPAVSSGSLAVMILFTSITATTSFIVFGLLIPDYGIAFAIIGFLSTVVGQVGLSIIMKHNKRNSYIAFSIGLVVVISTILMTIQSVFAILSGEPIGESSGVCAK